MTRKTSTRRRRFAVGIGAVMILSMVVGYATTAAAADVGGVPVRGSVTIAVSHRADKGVMVAVVNGVRRIPGGTVLYWSAGLPKGQLGVSVNPFRLNDTRILMNRWSPSKNSAFAGPQLIDARGHLLYTALVDRPKGTPMASSSAAFDDTAGVMYSYYVVFPELPATTTVVDVALGWDDVVHAVPVEDGLLEPAVEAQGPLRTGTGWPTIDLAAVASSYEPSAGIYTWESEDSSLDDSAVTREGKNLNVDLASDVLFAVDSATLTSTGTKRVRQAAARIKARKTGGAVTVTGHTDGTASPAYNLKLSRRRAQSVVDTLKPLITSPGVDFAVVGKGEAQPVASNATQAGRAKNRRVAIVFTPEGG